MVRGLTRGGGDGMTSLLVSNQLSLKPSKVAIIVFCRSVLLSQFFQFYCPWKAMTIHKHFLCLNCVNFTVKQNIIIVHVACICILIYSYRNFAAGSWKLVNNMLGFFFQLNYSIVSFSSSSNTNDFLVVSSNNVVTSAENPHDT